MTKKDGGKYYCTSQIIYVHEIITSLGKRTVKNIRAPESIPIFFVIYKHFWVIGNPIVLLTQMYRLNFIASLF